MRLMLCVDEAWYIRAKEEGRSSSSPSEREAIIAILYYDFGIRLE